MDPEGVDRERQRREGMWGSLLEKGGPSRVLAATVRELRIYGGAQGVWVDTECTRGIIDDSPGLAVGILHTGKHYPDDLDVAGVRYHYPATDRAGVRDSNEIQSIRDAGSAGLPMFFVSHDKGDTRKVQRCWLVGDSPNDQTFYLSFLGHEPVSSLAEPDEKDFVLDRVGKRRKAAEVATRDGQARFRFSVLKRYGRACVACSIVIEGLLECAHLKPYRDGGTDDPRNGLPLCRNHHAALDRGLFGIDPTGFMFVASETYDLREDLGIDKAGLGELKAKPHEEAVRLLWEKVFMR